MNKLLLFHLFFLPFPAFVSGRKIIAEKTKNTGVGNAVNGDMEWKVEKKRGLMPR